MVVNKIKLSYGDRGGRLLCYSDCSEGTGRGATGAKNGKEVRRQTAEIRGSTISEEPAHGLQFI